MQKREASANPEEPPRADELFPPGRAIGSKGVIGSPARAPTAFPPRGWPARPHAPHRRPPGTSLSRRDQPAQPRGGAASRDPPVGGRLASPAVTQEVVPCPRLPPLHSTLPVVKKRRLGQGGSQRQAGSAGMRSGEAQEEGGGAGQARAPRGTRPAGAAGTRWRRWRRARREAGPRTFPPLRPRGARPARSGQRLAGLGCGRGGEWKRGEGRARPGPLCKAPAAAAATAPWQR